LALAHFDGELSRDEAQAAITLATRQFARRQRTWFRKFREAERVRAPETTQDLSERVGEVLRVFDWN
ncbi:MAG: hypothetical protein HUU28_16015, partial [Planctomycetaceae bacterium]|nr:hypothetical protein [Planctomycetaceae bacterium]